MLPAAPTDSPQMLTIVNVSSSSMMVYWQAPSDDQHNGIIRQYAIVLQDIASGEESTLTSLGSSTTITGLKPFTLYNCKVAAFTVSLGPYSPAVNVTTQQDGK